MKFKLLSRKMSLIYSNIKGEMSVYFNIKGDGSVIYVPLKEGKCNLLFIFYTIIYLVSTLSYALNESIFRDKTSTFYN
jgi:hypothetical protein